MGQSARNGRNDFLKFGGDVIVQSLTDMFTTIADVEIIPDDWRKGTVKPLHTYMVLSLTLITIEESRYTI